MVKSGQFREDLFYRLAVAVIKVPPLQERPGDLTLLIDALFAEIKDELGKVPGFQDKKLSAGGRNILLKHSWPGNVRELYNTIYRAAIWSEGPVIGSKDVEQSILQAGPSSRTDVLKRPLRKGFNLSSLLTQVARHYINRALDETTDNKTRAADLLGFSSYQTLNNWMKKHGVQR
jgi:DNA-binding NtrC family response regulator